MAKTVAILRDATIIKGNLKGVTGKVVSYDYPKDEVVIELDGITLVTVKSVMIEQDI